MSHFDFDPDSRKQLLNLLLAKLENYYAQTKNLKVSSDWNVREVKDFVRTLSFQQVNSAEAVVDHVVQGMTNYTVHTPHPNYFGLFNPRANFASILADLITATFNPQMAAWSHAPFANEIEQYIIQEFGKKFGYEEGSIDGTFCTGGAESNLTGVLCALNHFFPAFNETGIQGIDKQLVIYCSSEAHHSIVKAAKMTGLGSQSVQSIPVNESLAMDTGILKKQIQADRQKGLLPFLIVGTAGTTGAGAIDDLNALHLIAAEEKMWFHVDAAYGGAIITSDKYRNLLSGIHKSDSITLDMHKWFSAPMGTSVFLTSHKNILHQSFRVKTNYMPADGDPDQIIDPYLHSVQWSRRFNGLKIYLPLAIHGWKEYEQLIDQQIDMGAIFKKRLQEKDWEIVNHSPLPILCFRIKGTSNEEMIQLVNNITHTGKAWLSIYPIRGQHTIRVCFTNYSTTLRELDELLELLEKARNLKR